MVDRKAISAMVAAAGSGTRLGLGPKAFLPIGGRPLLAWVADKMRRIAGEVVLAVPEDRIDEASSVCPDCVCIAGSDTRQKTIEKLAAAANRDILLLHDLARPFCSMDLLERVCAAAHADGVAGAFLAPLVPMARISPAGWLESTLPAEGSAIFQCPQAFRRELLEAILRESLDAGWVTQSTIELAFMARVPVRAVPGEIHNIKITTREDWKLAQSLKDYLA